LIFGDFDLGAPPLRVGATLRGSLSLGPCGSGALRHRSTSLAQDLSRNYGI
jgi:hypothetical protein